MTAFEKLGASAWSLFAMAILTYIVVNTLSCGVREAENFHLRQMKAIENKLNPTTLKPEQPNEQ